MPGDMEAQSVEKQAVSCASMLLKANDGPLREPKVGQDLTVGCDGPGSPSARRARVPTDALTAATIDGNGVSKSSNADAHEVTLLAALRGATEEKDYGLAELVANRLRSRQVSRARAGVVDFEVGRERRNPVAEPPASAPIDPWGARAPSLSSRCPDDLRSFVESYVTPTCARRDVGALSPQRADELLTVSLRARADGLVRALGFSGRHRN